ncbi:MAG TPA: hypothetical protein VGE04_00290 [Chloroflexia bacterium]|jgi:hypothetical protein
MKRWAIVAVALACLVLAGTVVIPRIVGFEYQLGEPAEIRYWFIKVTKLEATDVLTLPEDTGSAAHPGAGKFWLAHLELHSDHDNTLSDFEWALIDTNGKSHRMTAIDPGYILGVEWLGPPTDLTATLVFDLPKKVVPSQLLVSQRSERVRFKLDPGQSVR